MASLDTANCAHRVCHSGTNYTKCSDSVINKNGADDAKGVSGTLDINIAKDESATDITDEMNAVRRSQYGCCKWLRSYWWQSIGAVQTL